MTRRDVKGPGPSGRRRGASRLVPLNEPRAVDVGVDERGVPVTVTPDRRPIPVEAVRETWRIDDEWWRRPIARHYHALVLRGGGLVTVYHDLESGGWYLHA